MDADTSAEAGAQAVVGGVTTLRLVFA